MIKIDLRDVKRYSDISVEQAQAIDKIKRLAKKHQNLAVMDCKGVGTIRGITYYNGNIDDYSRRTYGQNVKSAYTNIIADGVDYETTIFDEESAKITDKILVLCKSNNLKAEFQGDPRGNTVRLFIIGTEGREITELLS